MNPRTKRRRILENILHAQQHSKTAKNLSNEINDFVEEKLLELKKMKFVEKHSIMLNKDVHSKETDEDTLYLIEMLKKPTDISLTIA